MAENTMLQMLASLSGGVDSEQTKLNQLAQAPIQQSFRNPGQTGMDMMLNPDAMQSKALMNIGLNILGSYPRKGVGAGVADSISKG